MSKKLSISILHAFYRVCQYHLSMELNEKLKNLRTHKELTQLALAKQLNVNQSTIAGWENGTHKPSLSMIISLAKFYKISSDYLLGLVDEFGNLIF